MRPISRINKGISINELLSAPIHSVKLHWALRSASRDLWGWTGNLRTLSQISDHELTAALLFSLVCSKVMIIFHDTLLSANTVCDCEAMLNNLQLHLCFHLNINTVFFTITYRSALWLLSLCSSASPSCLYQVRTVSHFTFVLFSQPFKWDGSQGGCSAPWTATLNASSQNTVGQTSCETARTLIPTRTLNLNMKNIKDFLSL